MSISAIRGSIAAKQGYDYENTLIEYFNRYDIEKNSDKNLFTLAKYALAEAGVNILDVKSLTTKKPKKKSSKPDLIFCLEFYSGMKREIGANVKKGSNNSSINFNTQSLKNFLIHPTIDFSILYPLGVIALSKYLGLEPYKTLWFKEYGHEERTQGCYLLEELTQEERKELIKLCTDKNFLDMILHKIFVSNNSSDTEKADICLYPRIHNSINAKDFVIFNNEKLKQKLLNDFENDKNIIKNIDPDALPRPGIRKKNNIPNTINYNDLFHMQRRSGSGSEQTSVQIQVNLENLDKEQKIVKKTINQKIAGKNTFENQKNFRAELYKKHSSEYLSDYIVRSSPYGYELGKTNFLTFWSRNRIKFDLCDINEKDVVEGILYILGTPGYSPMEAFQKNKLEKINKNELLVLKTLPYYYLKGSIKQEIKNFFDKNIRVFLEQVIFNNSNKTLKGIIYNAFSYKEKKVLYTKLLEKNKFLDYAVELYKKQNFTKATKSLNLGICYLKKYGGGGKKATAETKSSLVLSLNNKGFDNLL